jgi:hypothetical protein
MIKGKRMKWAGHVEYMRGKRNACRKVVVKSEGKY